MTTRGVLYVAMVLLALATFNGVHAHTNELEVELDLPYDELSVLEALGGAPLREDLSLDSLLSLDDLSPQSKALLQESEHAQSLLELAAMPAPKKAGVDSYAASQPKPAAAAPAPAAAAAPAAPAPVARREVQNLNGRPSHGGVDEWAVDATRPVYRSPFGAVIGNLAPGSELVIEQYLHGKEGMEDALWGWGYIKAPGHQYGGWLGANSCGWFPLQRETRPDGSLAPVTQWARLTRARHDMNGSCPLPPNWTPIDERMPAASSAPTKLNHEIDPMPVKVSLALDEVFQLGSYTPTFQLVKAIALRDCPTYYNYDPLTKMIHGSGPVLKAAVCSGRAGLGGVPKTDNTAVQPRSPVEGFGVVYVTQDAQMALVHHPTLDKDGIVNLFVRSDCIAHDVQAVAITNGASVEAASALRAGPAAGGAAAPAPAAAGAAAAPAAAPAPAVAGKGKAAPKGKAPGTPAVGHQQLETEAEAEHELKDSYAAEMQTEAEQHEHEHEHEAETEQADNENEHEPEAALMETDAMMDHELMDPLADLHNTGSRGNYPGWDALIEAQAMAAPVPAPAPAKVPRVEFSNAKNKHMKPAVMSVAMKNKKAHSTVLTPAIGLSKIHVHVYRKKAQAATQAQRLSNTVKRLAAEQKQSYDKINTLLHALKKCGHSKAPKECLPKITDEIQDWKAEWHGNKK